MIKTIKQWAKKSWLGSAYTILLSRFDNLFFDQNTAWKYDLYAWAGYMSNPIVYRCVNLIADGVVSIPFKIFRKTSDGKEIEVENHPALDLLNAPNPFTGKADFFAQFIQYLQLSGNVYVQSAGPSNGPPRELYLLRPDRIEIKDNSEIIYDPAQSFTYVYSVSGRAHEIDPRTLYHGKLFNPLCDRYGLSPLQAAATSVDQLNEALQWNVNLLRNAASPSGVLSSEHTLSDEQISELKQQMAGSHQGQWNSGRPLLLQGGLSYTQMGLSPKDMDFSACITTATKNIALTFGVDPSILGDAKNKTYSNFKEAQKAFYNDRILPLCDKIKDDFLNHWLLSRFPNTENMYFDYDLNEVEALNESQDSVYARIALALDSNIITVNEAREALGYSELADEPAAPEDSDQEETVTEEQQEEAREEFEDDETETAKKKVGTKAFNLETQEQKQLYMDWFESERMEWEEEVGALVTELFEEERDAVSLAIENGDSPEAAIDESAWNTLYMSFYIPVLNQFAQNTVNNFYGTETPLDEDVNKEIRRFARRVTAKRVKEVIDTTKKQIREVPYTPNASKYAKEVVTVYNHNTPIRSSAIAMTETITAASGGVHIGASSLGVGLEKEWVAVMDNRTRQSHAAAHGERIPFDELYMNGLRYPGDPDGPADEVINCRCQQRFYYKEGE